ncbi:MAG: putative 2OG-Fe(II) oxygenase [Proteobacteria bacterium]|nr:putative 2OG-Fe(II) oxygenase [Pseudomonadota bacterium]
MTLAVQLHANGRLDDAAVIYRQVLRAYPEHPDALSSLAMIESVRGKPGRALQLLRRAIARVDNNAGYFMNLGAVLDQLEERDAAANAYQRAIELEPQYPDPYYNLGDLYLREDQPDQAIEVFDACMNAIGREFHALAYKSFALIDAGRLAEANYLMDIDQYVRAFQFSAPAGYPSLAAFNEALATHIKSHPTLQANVMSTEHGSHTGELLDGSDSPMSAMVAIIHEAISWYVSQLPDDPQHPAVRWVPAQWKLTSWGVVMNDRGHERPHIHPRGWLSGVFYLTLPEIVVNGSEQHEGWLEFGRASPDLHVSAPPHPRHFQPACGQMFLFPSYFYHGTVPFRSEQERICVAFDVEPV